MRIMLEDILTWPRLETIWQHTNGNRYSVIAFANIETDRQDSYPTTIIYRNINNDKLYCRRLIDWERSMIAVNP